MSFSIKYIFIDTFKQFCKNTAMPDYSQLLEKQKLFFAKGSTLDIGFRKNALKRLYKALKAEESELLCALTLDLGKSQTEGFATEVGIVLSELRNAISNVHKWASKKRVHTALLHFPSSSYIIKEPYGNVLIMSPWNYPVQLTLVPLIGAIAAGCTAIVKPSRYSANTSKMLKKIIESAFDEAHVALVEGGREENEALLKLEWDYIFFTGSPNVGRIVQKKAAEDLTPTTLELGGKSPVIIDESANIKIAASRLTFGKFMNAGQTCIAPDYVFIHRSKTKEFLEQMKIHIEKYYGKAPLLNPEFGKIINKHHFERLNGLIAGSPVYFGGGCDEEKNKIEPTILFPAQKDEPIMQEEIFGPVLPVMEYENLEDVISFIRNRPHPLALYVFSNNKKNIEKIHSSIRFGGGCINDCIMHIVSHNLPFGGFRQSGLGAYHGRRSFETFTHEKSILNHHLHPDITLRCPPYKNKLGIIKMMLR